VIVPRAIYAEAHDPLIRPQENPGSESGATLDELSANSRPGVPAQAPERFIAAVPVLAGIGVAAVGYLVWLLLERAAAELGAPSPEPVRDGLFVVLLSVQVGYFLAAVPRVRRTGQQCLAQVRPLLTDSDSGLRELIDRFATTRALPSPYTVVVGGVLMVVMQEVQLDRFSTWFAQPGAAFGELFTVLLAWFTWSLALSALVLAIGDAIAMRRLGLKYVKINLLRADQLVVFSRYGLNLAGAVMGLMVLWSVCFVFVTSLLDITMTAGVVALGLLVLTIYMGLAVSVFIFPQLGVRAQLRAEKARLSEQLNALLPDPAQALELAHADPQRLAALLTTRADIQAVPEWPTGHLTRTRLGLYLLVPLFSWSGAALVEELISRQLGW